VLAQTIITNNCNRVIFNPKIPIQTRTNISGDHGWVRVALIGRNPKATFVRVVAWAVLVVIGYNLSVVHVRVDGISMLPTCPDKSVHWVNRLAYVFHEPQRGDVVAIRFFPPDGSISRLETPRVMLLKRIIGLPGETVAFASGRVLINGRVLDEPYENDEKFMGDWNVPPVHLAAGEYYVVGDNRSMPEADHTKGVWQRSQIVGKTRL
jgi:signal peptidase I